MGKSASYPTQTISSGFCFYPHRGVVVLGVGSAVTCPICMIGQQSLSKCVISFHSNWRESRWSAKTRHPMCPVDLCRHLLLDQLSLKHRCSYTELQATLTVWWSPCLATAFNTAAHPTHPQCFLGQQRFFRRPTNISQRLCVMFLAPYSLDIFSFGVVMVQMVKNGMQNYLLSRSRSLTSRKSRMLNFQALCIS